ncbi:hypothetical protein [Phosphitispora fastidiosa]|nr:hypothetical protein [Phosphitispora fastidiosa]MBU7005433.1 putative membrane protein [Phosphitispora fastidiosa]
MQSCKICGEKISIEEKSRGTCSDCETAIAKLIIKKSGKGIYPRKVSLKY